MGRQEEEEQLETLVAPFICGSDLFTKRYGMNNFITFLSLSYIPMSMSYFETWLGEWEKRKIILFFPLFS
jgi:hypothetical protein